MVHLFFELRSASYEVPWALSPGAQDAGSCHGSWMANKNDRFSDIYCAVTNYGPYYGVA
jgi:hypothetical protein